MYSSDASDSDNVTSAPRQIIINSYQNQIQFIPNIFYYKPPNDLYHYHISCIEVPYNTIISLLNNNEFCIQTNEYEYIFYYQQQYDNRFYKIICEIIPPFSITNYLNKIFMVMKLVKIWNRKD
ncbi:hypothetical protein RhiirA1_461833 [Rhizophagus irregularis]|uniref:Uncharacterized protein n=1 Tax=Rhizophagus irregularis TaxID=588596 RepID=A0A2N0RNG0_9GLOM|nr:hypothetical protein RhiirA1_461833 [Rhizophagus irregularis]UZO11099.1 hypothetical protein OCT59_002673 [Rhizophagus irregularis]CAB4493691.1 unnamed protein product [Rhizophagus irregularis]